MRRVVPLVLLLLPLTACAGGPQALGITGPGTDNASGVQPSVDPFDNPTATRSGMRYGPSAGPSTGSGRFWGYD